MRRNSLALVIAVAIALLLSGCPRSGQAPGGVAGGTLTLALDGTVINLDPHNYKSMHDGIVGNLVYDNLVTYDEDRNIVPELAESYVATPLSGGGVKYTFQLRKGIQFHDGTPFNAAAVKTNFDRVLTPERASTAWAVVPPLTRVEVVDEYTVEMFTATPDLAFLHGLASHYMVIISPKALEQYGDTEITRNMVGTGLYRFVAYEPDRHVILERNADYFRGAASIERIVFRLIPDANTRLMAFLADELDVVGGVAARNLPRFEGDPTTVMHFQPVLRMIWLGMHFKDPPFDDIRVRRAVAMSINVPEK